MSNMYEFLESKGWKLFSKSCGVCGPVKKVFKHPMFTGYELTTISGKFSLSRNGKVVASGDKDTINEKIQAYEFEKEL